MLKKLFGKKEDASQTMTAPLPSSTKLLEDVPRNPLKQQVQSNIANNSNQPRGFSTPPQAVKAPPKEEVVINNEILKETKQESNIISSNKIIDTNAIAEEVATLFADGNDKKAITKLGQFINDHKGNVDRRLWFMLMDMYQTRGEQQHFEKAAILFSNVFGCSPPSWSEGGNKTQEQSIANKNILILNGGLTKEITKNFKEFVKNARLDKFCRVEASRLKLENSDLSCIQDFIALMTELRKYKVPSILIGDSNIINFCFNYIKEPQLGVHLLPTFIQNEQIFWLLALEVLQWKGRNEEFEELAFEFAVKFELSPPGWDESGIMKIEKPIEEEDVPNKSEYVMERVLNEHNVSLLMDFLTEASKEKNRIEINFDCTERMDFSVAGNLTYHIQELKTQYPQNSFVFKHPNELIIVILEMVGATEFIEIEYKKR